MRAYLWARWSRGGRWMMEGVGKQDDSKARDDPFGFRPELTRSDGPHPCCGIGRDDRDVLNILLLWLQTGPPLSL